MERFSKSSLLENLSAFFYLFCFQQNINTHDIICAGKPNESLTYNMLGQTGPWFVLRMIRLKIREITRMVRYRTNIPLEAVFFFFFFLNLVFKRSIYIGNQISDA